MRNSLAPQIELFSLFKRSINVLGLFSFYFFTVTWAFQFICIIPTVIRSITNPFWQYAEGSRITADKSWRFYPKFIEVSTVCIIWKETENHHTPKADWEPHSLIFTSGWRSPRRCQNPKQQHPGINGYITRNNQGAAAAREHQHKLTAALLIRGIYTVDDLVALRRFPDASPICTAELRRGARWVWNIWLQRM